MSAGGWLRPDWTLTCEQLELQRNGRRVLRGVDLLLRPGACLSIIGPNGSGKTSLLLALLGLLRPTSGRIALDGLRLERLSARRRGQLAAYVPQTIERIPSFSVYDVVAAARFPHVPPLRPLSQADEQIVRHALQQCGLEALAQRPINAVSGGERQKALIAAALAQDAQIMMLDEPDNALDPAHQVELVRLLRGWLAQQRGLVLISHDLQLPACLGGQVLALRDGQVFAHGPAAQVLTPTVLSGLFGARFVELRSPHGALAPAPWLGDAG